MPATRITSPGAARAALWITSPAPFTPKVKLTTTAMVQPRINQHACEITPVNIPVRLLGAAQSEMACHNAREAAQCSSGRHGLSACLRGYSMQLSQDWPASSSSSMLYCKRELAL